MKTKSAKEPGDAVISRRDVLRGAAAAAIVGASGTVALAQSRRSANATRRAKTEAVAMRYMAAAAVLGDGRILVTGGYLRPFTETESPAPVNSVAIFDPATGEFSSAAAMNVPRARHSAVSLKDGRVAVIGGVSTAPTASIEVYDPGTDQWTVSRPLAQPRYDHTAVSDGDTVFVMGGSSMAMLSATEAVYPG